MRPTLFESVGQPVPLAAWRGKLAYRTSYEKGLGNGLLAGVNSQAPYRGACFRLGSRRANATPGPPLVVACHLGTALQWIGVRSSQDGIPKEVKTPATVSQ